MIPIDEKLSKTKSEPIRVIVRCRPMSSNEQQSGYSAIVNVLPSTRTVQVFDSPTDKVGRLFIFDAVYDTISSQEDLYTESVLTIIESVMRGYNATIFAYGQTGSGKTFTMEGSRDCSVLKGIIPRSFEQIFSYVDNSTDCDYSVIASYVEIYNEEVRDLLDYSKARQFHKLREDTEAGIFVKNVSMTVCKNVKDLEKVMRIGNQNRQTGFTHMNEHSSRSHAIFTITVEIRRFDTKHIRTGKLNLVDLAGSERQSKTNSTDERLKEASKINLSLSALGNVILALEKKQRHIPYRDSKLTRLLQDSLGGNSRTLMIANIGPASFNYEETLMTLRYASRARRITNRPTVNESYKDSMIKMYKEEIRRLKDMIAEKKKKAKNELPGSKHNQALASNKDTYEQGDYSKEGEIEIKDIRSNEEILKENNPECSNELSTDNFERILNKTYTVNDGSNKWNSIDLNDHVPLPNEVINTNIITNKENSDNARRESSRNQILLNHIEHLNKISESNRSKIEETAEMELELRMKIATQEKNNVELARLRRQLQKKVKLEKLLMKEYQDKLKCTKLRTQEIMDEFNTDRRSLNEIREELTKACKLNNLIIKHFLPPQKLIGVSFDLINDDYENIIRKQNELEANNRDLLLKDIISRNQRGINVWYRENEVLYLEPIDYNMDKNNYFTYYASGSVLKRMLNNLENQVKSMDRESIVEEAFVTSESITKSSKEKVYPKTRGLVPR